MSVTRTQVREVLSSKDRQMLAAVLEASDVRQAGDDTAEALAVRLVDALWWRTHTPAGALVAPDSLDRLVDRAADKLGLKLGDGDAWQRLDELTARVLPADEPIQYDDLDPEVKRKLKKRLWAQLLGMSGAGAAAGSRWLSLRLLAWTTGPIWDLLLMLPKVGPALASIRIGAGTVAALSGPVGVALALLTLNSTLGATDDRALPLLLGVGLVCRGQLRPVG